jgi:hypothetical protein
MSADRVRAILLVVSGSRGHQLAFAYPPGWEQSLLVSGQEQNRLNNEHHRQVMSLAALELVEPMMTATDPLNEDLGAASCDYLPDQDPSLDQLHATQSSSSSSSTPAAQQQQQRLHMLGIDTSSLCHLLTPKSSACGRRFQFHLDHAIFLGHPVLVDPVSTTSPTVPSDLESVPGFHFLDHADQPGPFHWQLPPTSAMSTHAEPVQDFHMTMFHPILVLSHSRLSNTYLDTVYKKVVGKLALVLEAAQRALFVSEQVSRYLLPALQLPISACFPVVSHSLSCRVSPDNMPSCPLAHILTSVYHGLVSRQSVHVKLTPSLAASFQTDNLEQDDYPFDRVLPCHALLPVHANLKDIWPDYAPTHFSLFLSHVNPKKRSVKVLPPVMVTV